MLQTVTNKLTILLTSATTTRYLYFTYHT